MTAVRATVRFQLDTTAWERDSLGPATAAAVPLSYVVALDGPASAPAVPGVDLRSGYALLAPQFVYDTGAQRFFRTTSPIGLTACQRSPYTEPPGSGIPSHPGSGMLSHLGSPDTEPPQQAAGSLALRSHMGDCSPGTPTRRCPMAGRRCEVTGN